MNARNLPFALLLTALLTTTAFARKWTDGSGKFSTEADFVELKDANAVLKKTDGKIISVPLEKLCAADRDFIDSRFKPKEPTEQKERIYYYRASNPLSVGRAQNISIREEADGSFTMKGLGRDSMIPASFDVGDLQTGNVIHPKYSLPGAGSTKIRVLINSSLGHTTLAGLQFQHNATVDIREDCSLKVDRAGIRAADSQGGRYISETLLFPDGKTETVMLKAR